MVDSSTIHSIDISLSSYQNAAEAKYTFTIVSLVPITEDDEIIVAFPPEIEFANDYITVSSTSTNLIESIEATADFDDLTVTMQFTLQDDVDEIAISESFSFTIGNMLNPDTTAATSDFTF